MAREIERRLRAFPAALRWAGAVRAGREDEAGLAFRELSDGLLSRYVAILEDREAGRTTKPADSLIASWVDAMRLRSPHLVAEYHGLTPEERARQDEWIDSLREALNGNNQGPACESGQAH